MEIARLVNVKSQPVRKAIEQMANENLVNPVNGVGVFVSDGEKNYKKIMILGNTPPYAVTDTEQLTEFLSWEVYQGISARIKECGHRPICSFLEDHDNDAEKIKDIYMQEECSGIILLSSSSDSTAA
ncbi:MAG: hypothetical protein ACYTFY_22270, partial [Planctomycetota bacterium]